MVVSIRRFSASLVLAFALLSGRAFAADDGDITYTVKPADTLYGLADTYFVDRSAALKVQEHNGILDPRRIPIGTQLSVPRRLLKFRPVRLVLQSFAGDVQLSRGSGALTPSLGLELVEGTEIATGPNSFVSISGEGASRIAIPSNSRARIVDARRYLISDEIEFELKVLKGRGEIVAPKIEGDGRYNVGTPIAVTAVRGTEFRVAFDTDTKRSLSEVLEGKVNITAGASEVDAAAGFGVAASTEGLGQVEALPPAPTLRDAGAIQVDEQVAFAIEPVDGAAGYRTQISRDGGFVDVIAEVLSEDNTPVFENLDDGRYFVGSRTVAPSGLEGSVRTYSFRRRQVSVDASVETSALADAFKFTWLSETDPTTTYAFQLWPSDQPSVLLVDEVALRKNAVLVSNLDPGTFKWRVASLVIDEGDVIKVWGPAQEFVVSE